jgi:predicted porin
MAFASTANAGITIPAGDWTVDLGGNVNAFYTNVSTDTSARGGATTTVDQNTIGTGLLPAAMGIGAKTRQNDLDIAIQFSFFTGTSSAAYANGQGNTLNIRQAYLTFGDASWGTIKAGRDLGIYASDAILSDMTLLGVGTGGAAGGSSTLGRIGSGYIYADWKGQISYASPNWNGFSFAAGVMQPQNSIGSAAGAAVTTQSQENMGYEAKATYDFAANDVTGRVWVSGITQKTEFTSGTGNYTSRGFDIGAKVAYQGAGLVGYYYDGEGMDSQNTAYIPGVFNGNGVKSKDSGGYVQATFVVPGIGTKLGASWGVSNSKHPTAGAANFDIENESWIVGAYHPLTKSLNLVAEYTNQEKKWNNTGSTNTKVETDTVSLGAILFF